MVFLEASPETACLHIAERKRREKSVGQAWWMHTLTSALRRHQKEPGLHREFKAKLGYVQDPVSN